MKIQRPHCLIIKKKETETQKRDPEKKKKRIDPIRED